MKQEHPDSRRPYFVTAPLPVPASLETCSSLLQAAIMADTGDADPQIVAMVALPKRVMAVVYCRPKASHRARWRLLGRGWLRKRGASGTSLPITMTEITSPSALQNRIDFCHFAPARHGLVFDPMNWSHSTIRQHAPSDMILS